MQPYDHALRILPSLDPFLVTLLSATVGLAGWIIGLRFWPRDAPRPLYMGTERRRPAPARPWWIQVLYDKGVPTAMMLLLFFYFVRSIDGHQNAHDQALAAHVTDTTAAMRADADFRRTLDARISELIALTRLQLVVAQIECARTATTLAERRACELAKP